jgi:hypothetical protein
MPDTKAKKSNTMDDQLRNLIKITDKIGLRMDNESSNHLTPTSPAIAVSAKAGFFIS